MLQIDVQMTPEMWDEVNEVFIEPEIETLRLEHSLISLSKWESKWCKPFLSRDTHTREETLDYIRCMVLNENVEPDVFNHIVDEQILEIQQYINAPMTATTFPKDNKPKSPSPEFTTSELVYYWMNSFGIDMKCEEWHLNRLLTLIQIHETKNAPKKKMSMQDLMARNKARNAANKKFFKSRR